MDNYVTEIIGVKDVMQIVGCGRPTAEYLLSLKDCPSFPRKKGQSYKVSKSAFIKWFSEYEK